MTDPVILDILEMAKNIFSLLQPIGSISRIKENKIEKEENKYMTMRQRKCKRSNS